MSDEVVAAPEEIKEVEAPAGEEAPASVQEEPVAEEESKEEVESAPAAEAAPVDESASSEAPVAEESKESAEALAHEIGPQNDPSLQAYLLEMFGSKTTTPFSFGATNTATTTAAPSLFGAQTNTASKSLFGASTQPQTGGLFGTATTSSASLFGAPANPTASTSLFGAANTTTGLFSKAGTTTAFGSTPFGGGAKSLFGTAPAGQSAPAATTENSITALIQNSEALVQSVCNVELYGDERDKMIMRVNQLAASLGVGSAQYKRDHQPVTFNQQGPFFRFKAIGYNKTSSHTEEEGMVCLIVKAHHSQLSSPQQRRALIDALFGILDNKPELKAHIHLVQAMPNDTTKVIVYVTQNGLGRVKASQLASFFQQPNKKTQLENTLKDKITALVAIDSVQKRLYLNNVPQGFDQCVWDEAIQENPSPKTLIPFPMRGFEELRARQRAQQAEVEAQQDSLAKMAEMATSLECTLSASQNKIASLRAVQKQLSHRLLRIMAVQMASQRFAHGIEQSEEEMQTALENINVRLNAPNQIKAKVCDILQELKELNSSTDSFAQPRNPSDSPGTSTLSTTDVTMLKRYLTRCQDGLEQLFSVVKKNQEDLHIIDSFVAY